jgi:hypothetical protein
MVWPYVTDSARCTHSVKLQLLIIIYVIDLYRTHCNFTEFCNIINQ